MSQSDSGTIVSFQTFEDDLTPSSSPQIYRRWNECIIPKAVADYLVEEYCRIPTAAPTFAPSFAPTHEARAANVRDPWPTYSHPPRPYPTDNANDAPLLLDKRAVSVNVYKIFWGDLPLCTYSLFQCIPDDASRIRLWVESSISSDDEAVQISVTYKDEILIRPSYNEGSYFYTPCTWATDYNELFIGQNLSETRSGYSAETLENMNKNHGFASSDATIFWPSTKTLRTIDIPVNETFPPANTRTTITNPLNVKVSGIYFPKEVLKLAGDTCAALIQTNTAPPPTRNERPIHAPAARKEEPTAIRTQY